MEQKDTMHAYYMKQALLMGEKALQLGETPVGCVLVYAGKIVGTGMNDTNRSMNVGLLGLLQLLFLYTRSSLLPVIFFWDMSCPPN